MKTWHKQHQNRVVRGIRSTIEKGIKQTKYSIRIDSCLLRDDPDDYETKTLIKLDKENMRLLKELNSFSDKVIFKKYFDRQYVSTELLRNLRDKAMVNLGLSPRYL